MEDYCEFPSDGDFCFLGPDALGKLEPPRLERRSSLHNLEQDICGLKQVIAGQPLTALGDPAGPVQFPGLIPAGCKTKISADIAGSLETARIVNGTCEGQSGDRPKVVYDLAVKNGDIEGVPFEVMRGRSWRDAFILLDEAQDTSVTEIKMFLTRIGEGCTTVINGDIAQCDLPQGSFLHMVISLVRKRNLPVLVVEFSADDIVRSGLCAMWVSAFEEKGVPALTL